MASEPDGEEAAALHPTTDELTLSASTEAAARPASEVATALTPTANELATLREAGLEPRKGVLGLFLCRDHRGDPIVPPEPIKLEGRARELADAMRDELATRLREKGTEGLPTAKFNGEERADLMGAWLQGRGHRRAGWVGVGCGFGEG